MALEQTSETATLAFTAVFLKLNGEYIGFIEELPALNARGRTLHEARAALQDLAREVFEEARAGVAAAHASGDVLREEFFIRTPLLGAPAAKAA
jgi:predicted RNase H-like HicB family nuclease